jgi:rubrerythrin
MNGRTHWRGWRLGALRGPRAGRMTAPVLRGALRPAQYLVWNSLPLRARNLLRFAETEADGGRDLVRAAEVTRDPILRRLFIFHAKDEQRHADLFRRRGASLLRTLPASTRPRIETHWLTPGERGLDDLKVGEESDASLLAFLHLSEKSAARDFAVYRDLLAADPETRAVFEEILHDETFHMNYTLAQLNRVAPRRRGWHLWRARLSRLWKGYLRVAGAIAGVISRVVLTALYFILLPPFAWFARNSERREPLGWVAIKSPKPEAMKDQY